MTEKKTPVKRKPRKTKSKGLGDTIDKVTEATGIKAVVKAVAGDDCGCQERKDKLNEMFPYASAHRMDDRQKTIWQNVVAPARRKGYLTAIEGQALRALFLDFGITKPNWNRCGSCATKSLDEMTAIYDASCEKS